MNCFLLNYTSQSFWKFREKFGNFSHFFYCPIFAVCPNFTKTTFDLLDLRAHFLKVRGQPFKVCFCKILGEKTARRISVVFKMKSNCFYHVLLNLPKLLAKIVSAKGWANVTILSEHYRFHFLKTMRISCKLFHNAMLYVEVFENNFEKSCS
jgi:hypothetical protein